jgi:hypothetical protein
VRAEIGSPHRRGPVVGTLEVGILLARVSSNPHPRPHVGRTTLL